MFNRTWHDPPMSKSPTRIFKAFARPCSVNIGRFRWMVVANDGGHSEHATNSYVTRDAAQMAGDARAQTLTDMRYVAQ
ncbi:hypothetical protein EKPJFOCH_0844 [Methylobacterium thuringiense]|uniref:DUF1508 domain-containing protein n=1 Tax=Methylobacterium thuringiense TaxID=1003091 RepID=A0ABQ4THR3_9HYPH|nr:hypothetical protein EKPJFOCH_0844 [Methylobacterium thuringiense]